jgi:hypothetical protein
MPGKKKSAKSQAARQADRQLKVPRPPKRLPCPQFLELSSLPHRPNSCSALPSPLVSLETWTRLRKLVTAPLPDIAAQRAHATRSAVSSQIPIPSSSPTPY